jgi:dephospho-CoA kinase
MTKIVGLTGGIASGKSTVAALLRELGAVVIDADAIVHELQAPGSIVLDELAIAFGNEIIDASGALDREALGAIVFRDPEARARLGAILHPKVGAEMAHRTNAARRSGAELIVLDIPLLLESRKSGTGSAAQLGFEATIVVYVPEALQIERQIERDGCDADEAIRRIRSQLPIEEKKGMADFVIDNSGTRSETEKQVRELHAKLTAGQSPEPGLPVSGSAAGKP